MGATVADLIQVFELHVAGVTKPCGESNVQLNGQELEAEWDGLEGHGYGQLDFLHGIEASWTITCLYENTEPQNDPSDSEDAVHLLRLSLESNSGDDVATGFTISYKQSKRPSIVRFSPNLVTFDAEDKLARLWQRPSSELASYPSTAEPVTDIDSLGLNHFDQNQKGLGTSLKAFGQAVSDKFRIAIEKLKLCNGSSKPQDVLLAQKPHQNETREITSPTDSPQSTYTVSVHNPAETRSLHTLEEPSLSAANQTSDGFIPLSTHHNYEPLKIFGLGLFLLTLLAWLYVRYNDPRRRADRAALREERTTKRLYRRAARRQKIKNWLWNFRIKYKLASKDCLDLNEKQARVTDQEDVLESVMKDDIRALRNAHRVVSSVTAAEEGRNYFEYGESSHRRQSVSTLPGYESEGTQPPGYDEAGRSVRGESESDPDSSVVSTSPRLSRDGTNSDFDEKIEVLSLDPRGVSSAISTTHQL